MTFTDIQARVSKTTTFIGAGLDVSGISDDWTIKLQVESLAASTGNKRVRFVIEDTVNDWTASLAGPSFSVKGTIVASADKVMSIKKADFPSLRIGVANGQIRLKLSEVDSGVDSVVYKSWLEY